MTTRGLVKATLSSVAALFAAAVLTIGGPANAVVLHYDGMSVAGPSLAAYFGGAGTVLTASLDFDISAGTPSSALESGLSGSVTWNDGVDRIFNVTGYGGGVVSSSGFYSIQFDGTGPVIGTSQMVQFIVNWQLGLNPFTTSLELSDLLLSGPLSQAQVRIQTDGAGTAFALGATTADVTLAPVAMPEPGTLAILGFGLIGIAYLRRKTVR